MLLPGLAWPGLNITVSSDQLWVTLSKLGESNLDPRLSLRFWARPALSVCPTGGDAQYILPSGEVG